MQTEPARDGTPLAVTWHGPDRGPIVIIAGAMGVKRGFYAPFAEHIASTRGFRVLTFDYRGIGDSPDPGNTTLRTWAEQDLAGMIDICAEEEPLCLQLVGHSVSGQLLGLTPNASRLESCYLVASQSGWYGHWEGMMRNKIWAWWHLMIPALTGLTGRLPGWAMGGEPVPKGVARQWATWGRLQNYMVEGTQDAKEGFEKIECPVCFIGFTDDDFATRRAVEALADWFRNANPSRRFIAPGDVGLDTIRHFGFFEPAAQLLWEDAADWLIMQSGLTDPWTSDRHRDF